MAYAGLGFELLGVILFFGAISYALDHYILGYFGPFLVPGLLLGVFFALYYTVRRLTQLTEEEPLEMPEESMDDRIRRIETDVKSVADRIDTEVRASEGRSRRRVRDSDGNDGSGKE